MGDSSDKEEEMQILLLLATTTTFLQLDQQLLHNLRGCSATFFHSSLCVKPSLGFNYFPSVALFSCTAKSPHVREALLKKVCYF